MEKYDVSLKNVPQRGISEPLAEFYGDLQINLILQNNSEGLSTVIKEQNIA